jgi:hypothetical protein
MIIKDWVWVLFNKVIFIVIHIISVAINILVFATFGVCTMIHEDQSNQWPRHINLALAPNQGLYDFEV